jgi:hypothetical protein
MKHLVDLVNKSGFADPKPMLLSKTAMDNLKSQPGSSNTMLQALADGDLNEFVTRAQALGISKSQAQLAIRDTAALAAIAMQVGQMDAW